MTHSRRGFVQESRGGDELRRAAVCLVAGILVGSLPVSAAQAGFPGRPGEIFFQGSAGGSDASNSTSNLYRMGRNGNRLRQITDDGGSHSPSVSPDGTRIVFNCRGYVPRRSEICVMNLDGSGRTRLTRNRIFDGEASWSRDGTKILFSRFVAAAESTELFTMSAKGRKVRRITHNRISEASAVWDPQRDRIAYVRLDHRDAPRQMDIFTIRPDGTHRRRVTRTASEEDSLDWHPGGKKLVFVRNSYLVIKRLGRSGSRRVTGGRAYAVAPAWSPHGRKIVFERQSHGTRPSGLVKLDPRDCSMTLLLRAPPIDENGHCQPGLCHYTSPSWQPRR